MFRISNFLAIWLLTTIGSVCLAQDLVIFNVTLDRGNLGEVNLVTPISEETQIVADELENLLRPILKPSVQDRLALAAKDNRISTKEIKRLGIQIEIKESDLILDLVIPMDLRQVKDLSLVGTRALLGQNQDLDPYAGYLNADILVGATQNQNTNGSEIEPTQGQLELVQGLKFGTFESSAYYQEYQKNPWEIGNTSIVKDLEPSSTRLRFGDYNPMSIGFMSGISGAGVTISKEFSINPRKQNSTTRTALIEVKLPSVLEIYVDKVLISRIRANPGPFNLRDLPLLAGRNQVQVKIIDDFGGTEEFTVDLFFDGQILAKNQHEYSYFYGNPVTLEDRIRRYDNFGFLSLFHRYGLSDQITLGANIQTYKNRQHTGIELGYVNQLGTWKYDLGYSDLEKDFEQSKGFADRFKFYSHEQSMLKIRGLRGTLDYEHRTSRYSPLTIEEPQFSDYATRLEVGLSKGIRERWNARIGSGYIWKFNKTDDRLYRAGLQGSISKNLALDVNYSRTSGDKADDQLFVNLTWTEPSGGATASTFYESAGKSSTFSYTQNRLPEDTSNANLTIQESPEDDRVSFRVGHYARKAELSLSHESQKRRSDTSHSTNVGLGTALAWTTRSIALSRPIDDSFAVLHVKGLPKGATLGLQPSGGLPETLIEKDQYVVLPQVSSYSSSSVSLDSTLLESGLGLERENYNFSSKYLSGAYIPVNITKSLIVIGSLQDQNGKPISFAGGQVMTLDDQIVTETFFTNADGKFILDRVPAGKYKVKLSDIMLSVFSLDIPETSSAEIEVPSITVPKRNIQQ